MLVSREDRQKRVSCPINVHLKEAFPPTNIHLSKITPLESPFVFEENKGVMSVPP